MPPGQGLAHPDGDACASMAARLSTVENLRLPASLLRTQPYPDAAAIQQHLQDLLQRDAAVFLEVCVRHHPASAPNYHSILPAWRLPPLNMTCLSLSLPFSLPLTPPTKNTALRPPAVSTRVEHLPATT